MIIDGKKIAEDILRNIHCEYTLGVIMNKENVVSESFVTMKERIAKRVGVRLVRYMPEDIAKALQCDGVLVQLPIENADALLAMVPPEKDVDALGLAPLVRPTVAGAVAEIFSRYAVDVSGKKAVVVGAGRLVGAPCATLLRELGANVFVITEKQGSLTDLKDANIVVLGAGSPCMVTPNMLKHGVVLIDAGVSESKGSVVGDADPACADVASLFTPVPGGIGPIAVAMIFKNLFTLMERKSWKSDII